MSSLSKEIKYKKITYTYDESHNLKGIVEGRIVDAVEVVRCKNCEYNRAMGCSMEPYFSDRSGNTFCSDGEKKGEQE